MSYLRKIITEIPTVKEVASTLPRERRLLPERFYVNKIVKSVPKETQKWIRSEADERAVHEFGCRFSTARGEYVVNWLEENFTLYEGSEAGNLIRIEDWHYEYYMQVFGWLVFDPDWEAKGEGLGWVRRYVKVSGWVPKKNAKSPTLAATGIYLLCADGEMGQKCFSTAFDYNQAKLAHTHAEMAVKYSASLSARCKVNATTGEITDTLTSSSYRILSGTTGSNINSKEGINGSLLVDESHVVNRAFMKIVSRAGISRRQPLLCQLSTAGSNLSGYGYEEFLEGRKNVRAAKKDRPFDHRTYHFEYAIPQQTTLEELRDPDKIDDFIRIANPTLGRIVRMSEIKRDWQNSCQSDTSLAEFAMYRLDLWSRSGGKFVAGPDWTRLAKPITMKSMEDYPLVIGADLSKARDMTALVLAFAVPETRLLPENPFDPDSKVEEREIIIPHIIPNFWVPKRALPRYVKVIDIEALKARKQLFVTTTPIIKPEAIAEHIGYLENRYDLRYVASDSYYSRPLLNCLITHHGWEEDDERFQLISQSISSVSPAVEQLRNLVLAKELAQDGNEVMTWQLGNIDIREDANGNCAFVKPSHDSMNKIDGWAGLLNAIFSMMNTSDMYPGYSVSISLGA